MSYLTLPQWADLNPAAAFDFWLRDSLGLVNGGDYVKFMLPPLHGFAAMPTPILRRSTMYARADPTAHITLTDTVNPLGANAPLSLPLDLSGQGTATKSLIATLEVNAWCGRFMFDRLGTPLEVQQSHLALLTYLRQFRDACINNAANLIFTTDQAYTEETYYIHRYAEDIMPWSYPDRDWLVTLTLIGVGNVAI